MTQDELVERCKRVAQDTADKWLHSKPSERADHSLSDAIAHAIIPIVLDLVESHLSACAYEPAPYTAMKYRLAAIRKEPTDE